VRWLPVVSAVCFMNVACAEETLTPPLGGRPSLTGTWTSFFVGSLTNFELQLTQLGTEVPVLAGEWKGSVILCSPTETNSCWREGTVSSEKSSYPGPTIVIELVPNTPCLQHSATITATLTETNRMDGTFSPHPCPNQDIRSGTVTLYRQ
jgi:hypothetical protein